MNFRNIVLFLSLFGFFIVTLNISFSTKRAVLRLCDFQEVTDFQIQAKDVAVNAYFDVSTGGWQLNTPEGDQADGGTVAIGAVTRLACLLPYNEKFTLDLTHADEELQAFGIKNTDRRFAMSIGKKKIVIEIGNDTPSGTEFYLRTSEEPNTVYTAINTYKKILASPFLDLHTRFPFFQLDMADSLKINFGNSQLFLKKKGKDWNEEFGLLTPTQAQKLIRLIKSFTYTNYKGPVENEEGKIADEFIPYGLDFPDVTVELKNTETSQPQFFNIVKVGSVYHFSILFNHKTYLLVLKTEALSAFFQILENLVEP
jgi:hypothetical protein